MIYVIKIILKYLYYLHHSSTMVQRYDSRRKPIYKDAPWYMKNSRKLMVCGWTGGLLFLFGPWLFSILSPSKSLRAYEVNPRTSDDIRKLRSNLRKRELELADSPCKCIIQILLLFPVSDSLSISNDVFTFYSRQQIE